MIALKLETLLKALKAFLFALYQISTTQRKEKIKRLHFEQFLQGFEIFRAILRAKQAR